MYLASGYVIKYGTGPKLLLITTTFHVAMRRAALAGFSAVLSACEVQQEDKDAAGRPQRSSTGKITWKN